MTIEVMKQALEALNKLTDVFLDTEGNHGDYERKALDQGNEAAAALRKAIEEAAIGSLKNKHNENYTDLVSTGGMDPR